MDFVHLEVKKDGVLVPIASKEFQLLKYLVINRGRSISREEILESVWGYDANITTRTIDTHVGWLRQKLEDEPKNPKLILTVFGYGYRFLK
jgi:two-component system alkaline phosphatase synthesis response regulator PhoP